MWPGVWASVSGSACFFFFFFNDTATTEIYTLSLHDALPICQHVGELARRDALDALDVVGAGSDHRHLGTRRDRKSTRLNSSHGSISYAVFCLKKKKKHTTATTCDVYSSLAQTD